MALRFHLFNEILFQYSDLQSVYDWIVCERKDKKKTGFYHIKTLDCIIDKQNTLQVIKGEKIIDVSKDGTVKEIKQVTYGITEEGYIKVYGLYNGATILYNTRKHSKFRDIIEKYMSTQNYKNNVILKLNK
jgi:hypothetical protein